MGGELADQQGGTWATRFGLEFGRVKQPRRPMMGADRWSHGHKNRNRGRPSQGPLVGAAMPRMGRVLGASRKVLRTSVGLVASKIG